MSDVKDQNIYYQYEKELNYYKKRKKALKLKIKETKKEIKFYKQQRKIANKREKNKLLDKE